MAKITTIGDETKALKEKHKKAQGAYFAGLDDNQLTQWLNDHFPGFPKEAREGMEVIVKALRAK